MAATQAPGALELVRSFVNTAELETGEDPLRAPDRLEEWCRSNETAQDVLEEAGLNRLRAFRESIREVLCANAGKAEPAPSWRGLEPFARASSYRLRIPETGAPSLEPLGRGPEGIIAALLAIVYDAVGAGTWPRLKACRKDSCRWAFYDRSKNGSGAWCDMAVCGNRMKAKRRRQREKSIS